MKRRHPLARVYQLLEPGPVVLLTTFARERPNVMAMSWHTMMDFDLPLIGCVLSERNYSFELLKTSRQCVINIPTVELARQTVACGNCSGRTVDKFQASGLTATAGSKVRAPLIEECYANIECRLVDARRARRYNFFVLEGLAAWIDPAVRQPQTLHHQGYGRFMTAGPRIRIASRKK